MSVDRLVGNAFHEDRPCGKKLFHADAGRDTHALEHEHQVLGDHVAARAGCEGAAAETAHGAVEVAHADFICRQRIGDTEPARVVKVRAFELLPDFLFYKRKNSFYLSRICVPDRVGESYRIAKLGERNSDSHHLFFGNLALQGAAEGGRHGAFDLDGELQLGAAAHFLDHLVRRHAHVRLAVGAARRYGKRYLVGAGLDRALEALQVRRERHDFQAGKGSRERDYV